MQSAEGLTPPSWLPVLGSGDGGVVITPALCVVAVGGALVTAAVIRQTVRLLAWLLPAAVAIVLGGAALAAGCCWGLALWVCAVAVAVLVGAPTSLWRSPRAASVALCVAAVLVRVAVLLCPVQPLPSVVTAETGLAFLAVPHAGGRWEAPSNPHGSQRRWRVASFFTGAHIRATSAPLAQAWLLGSGSALLDAVIAPYSPEDGPALLLASDGRTVNVSVDCTAYAADGAVPCVTVCSTEAGLPAPIAGLRITPPNHTAALAMVRRLNCDGGLAAIADGYDELEPRAFAAMRMAPALLATSAAAARSAYVAAEVVTVTVGPPALKALRISGGYVVGAFEGVARLGAAVACGTAAGARVPYACRRPAATLSLLDALRAPNATAAEAVDAALLWAFEVAEATAAVVCWAGVPTIWRITRTVADADLALTAAAYRWTVLPVGQAVLWLAVAGADAAYLVAGPLAEVIGRLGLALLAALAALAGAAGTHAMAAATAALRAVLWVVSLYADTSASVQVAVSGGQTAVIAYHFHMHARDSSWFGYPYALLRAATASARPLALYAAVHVVCMLIVFGAAFVPFAGAIGLRFLAVNVCFPAGSSYALLELLAIAPAPRSMAAALAARALVTVVVQKGIGDVVAVIIAELATLLAAAIALTATIWYVTRPMRSAQSPTGVDTAPAAQEEHQGPALVP